MAHESEATLENNLVKQLVSLGYESVKITDGDALVSNLKTQLEAFNKATYTNKEFDSILNHLEKGNEYKKAKTLRDRFSFAKDDASTSSATAATETKEISYVSFFDSENWNNNLFQVTNQVSQEGSFKNRYDVTLLINGLPLVQIELKRRGIETKEAFNQINRYQKQSFWSNHGLFQYVQLFVISNGGNTRYLANNKLQSVNQAFFWADENNKHITELDEFTKIFLNPDHLGKMIAKYIVINVTHKILMVLRPYQYYATEAIIKHVVSTPLNQQPQNAYIWHTTGSGKTLTSFKASQILMDLEKVYKVVFVVDRKDLDYQTMQEFNAFKEGSVDSTDNTSSLVNQFLGKFKDKKGVRKDSNLIITTIQKLNNAISSRYANKLEGLKNERFIFIFDECHRSQFGETHDKITKFFSNSQLFGFTGTPIFAENSFKNDLGKRTTKDLFGNCLHKYVITDAIRDQNVLRFGIEYYSVFKHKNKAQFDEMVEDIDKKEVFEDHQYLEEVTNYIIKNHDRKTDNKNYSAIFAVSDINAAIEYYELFQQKKAAGEHNLRIATIFTYGTNEEDDYAQDYTPENDYSKAAEAEATYKSSHTRDKLESFVGDYNKMYQKNYTTKDSKLFEGYFKDISKRFKDREKITFNDDKDRLDIVIVVGMMLTGFDAKKLNTLYVDKNLKQHGLIQAFSRTNRILGDKKSQGNILCFRNLKKATDDAITLFSNKEAIEVVVMPEYEDIAKKFDEAFNDLKELVPTYQSVNELQTEEDEAAFVQAFRKLLRNLNVLQSYTDFDWENMPLDEQEFLDYKGKYLDLYDKVRREAQKEKVSILNDIDFELELIHRDRVNVAYIIKLLAKMKNTDPRSAAAQKKAIIDLLGGDVMLRSKRELIEKFIDDNLPHIHDADKIEEEFDQYWQDQKVLALGKICEEESLDQAQFKSLIDTYIYSGKEPIRDDVFKCLDHRPSILKAREIGVRILNRMKEFVEVFVHGMLG